MSACHISKVSTSNTGRSELTPREQCSVESAALHHPQLPVYLLATSPVLHTRLPPYANLHPLYLDLATFFEAGGRLDALWSDGRIAGSRFPVSHLSDVVRFVFCTFQ